MVMLRAALAVAVATTVISHLALAARGDVANRSSGPTQPDSCFLQMKSKARRFSVPQSLSEKGAVQTHTMQTMQIHTVHTLSDTVLALKAAAALTVIFIMGVCCTRWAASYVAKLATDKDLSDDVGAVKANASDLNSEERQELSSMEMKISGMSCSACSSTVERYLNAQVGVKAATVSLVLEKASVLYDGSKVSAAALCEGVEDIGFSGAILSDGPLKDRSGPSEAGWANLHLKVEPEEPEGIAEFVDRLPGTLGMQRCAGTESLVICVKYQPSMVGARELLTQIKTAFPNHSISCAPAMEDDCTASLQQHAATLRTNFKWSSFPALVVFLITIVFPTCGIDLGSIHCITFSGSKIHIHIPTLLVFILATPVQFVFGADFHVQCRKALARGAPNMDVLVSMATSISYTYAIIGILARACRVGYAHNHNMQSKMHQGDDVEIELGCHALHFFGMAPILMAVVLGGKLTETLAKIGTMESLVRLMECKTHMAQLITKDSEEALPLELVQIGDTLRLHEGGRVPVDGVLASDAPVWVNEAILTGESKPVEKVKGSTMMGGSNIVSGTGIMTAKVVGSKTALGEITTLISNAQATKTRTQLVAGIVASWFVMLVLTSSFAVFATWLYMIKNNRIKLLPDDMGDGTSFEAIMLAAKFGVAVLMVACPCAMGLATPTAVMVSTGVAAKFGCFVKSAEALECGANVTTVILDKTGTITTGTPSVSGAVLLPLPTTLPDVLLNACPDFVSSIDPSKIPTTGHLLIPPLTTPEKSAGFERAFWWLVGVAESGSDHPLAKCLVRAASKAFGDAICLAPDQFRYRVGRGVSAVVRGSKGGPAIDVRVGNIEFLNESMEELKQDPLNEESFTAMSNWAASMRATGNTVVVVHTVVERRLHVLGAIALRDEVRPDAIKTIRYLQKNLKLQVCMCTGDNVNTAQAIAHEVGIPFEHVYAGALPKQKAERLADLRLASKGKVCMVGDGVNDAPALAAADIGIAVGAGVHLAMDAADVVLIRSELSTLVDFHKLSKQTVFTIRRNFVWAFIFNICGLPLAAGLFYPTVVLPPLVAGLAMGASSTLVISSSLMLKRFQELSVTLK